MNSRQDLLKLILQKKGINFDFSRIPRREKSQEIPLSLAQERLWFLNRLEESHSTYNISGAVSLKGNLNLHALQQALSEIVCRHEILRTSFILFDSQPRQIIHPEVTLKIELVDLQSLSPQKKETSIKERVKREEQTPFNLEIAPLARCSLLKLSPSEYILLLSIHHIIADGWSMGIIIQELVTFYRGYPLPELPIQYGDFSLWQRQQLTEEKLATQISYWKKRLHNAPRLLQLPADNPRSRIQSYRGGKQKLILDRALTKKLKILSRKSEATLFMSLLAAFFILLQRLSAQWDITVGSPVAGRNHQETEALIGFFLNTVVLRQKLSPNISFAELLQQVRLTALEAYNHQDLPFEKIVEELQPERSLSYNPLFQVLFNMLNLEQKNINIPDLTVETLDTSENRDSKFDLTLYAREQQEEIELWLVYNCQLFSSTRMRETISQYEYLLQQIVANPKAKISQLTLLTPQAKSLFPSPQLALPDSNYELVTTMFGNWVDRASANVAISQGTTTWNYGELSQTANTLAKVLITSGVERGNVVAVSGIRSFGLIASTLAVFLSGGVLMLVDPALPIHRRRMMLEQGEVKYVIYSGISDSDNTIAESSLVNLWVEPQTGANINGSHLDHLDVELPNLTPEDTAYIFFTSGTTGIPKGVLGSHRGLSHFLSWQQGEFAVQPCDRIAQLTGLSFDVVLRDIFLPLISGATLCLPLEEDILEPSLILTWLERESISLLHTVPSLAEYWLTDVPESASLQNLRCLFLAGEPLKATLVERWRETFPQGEGEIINLYGPTETTLAKCYYRLPQKVIPGIQSIGRSIPETQALILGENQQLCGVGEEGEIVIRTPFPLLGYVDETSENSSRFVKNPFTNKESDLLYYTGDRGRYCPDGSLAIYGRSDRQIKIRGVRIEQTEIEILLSQHPDVIQTAVIVRENSREEKQIIACVAVNSAVVVEPSQLRHFLRQRLPEYMVPSAFIILDTLPLTSNGKIDRQALLAIEPEIMLEAEYVAPTNQEEELLARVWSEVLEREKIGIHDNFFELGGHSLLATQVISRLQQALNCNIPLKTIFEYPTIELLGKTIVELQRSNTELACPTIKPAVDNNPAPLSFAQERLWFLDRLEKDNPAYNIVQAVKIDSHLDFIALERALSEVVRRHQILRTSFTLENETPIQIVAPNFTIKIPRIDLQSQPAAAKDSILQQQLTAEAKKPFDLVKLPLIRCNLWQLDKTEYVLLLTIHHIIADAWSIGILIEEISSLYRAYTEGKTSPLGELPIQYTDFALWQRNWLSSKILQTQLEYWKQELAEAPELLKLPSDRPRSSIQTYKGATHNFSLDTALTQKLRALSQKSGTTLFMTLYAGFTTLLYRYSGETDIVIGSPIANRNHREIEPLIGFFVNTLLLRTRLEDNPSFDKLLQQVRETTLRAYEYQDVPFDRVVEALQPNRSLSHTPLFQVMFILQNAPLGTLELPDMKIAPFEWKKSSAKFDLTLSMKESDLGLVGSWNYNTDLFDSTTIDRLASHFQNLLTAIVENPQQTVVELPLLSELERNRLLNEWNDTKREYPRDKCINQLFEEQVEKSLDAIAVVSENQQLTYQELNQKANQLARYLQKLGVAESVLVGIYCDRSVNAIISLLAVLKAGGAYVPFDPNYPQERLNYMLEDSQIQILLTQSSLLESLPKSEIRTVCLDCDCESIEQQSKDNLNMAIDNSNLAYVIYTSGSTGVPKGVAIERRSLLNYIYGFNAKVNTQPHSNFALVSTFSADLGNSVIFPSLLTGGCLHIISQSRIFDSQALGEYFTTNKIDYLKIVSSHLAALAESNSAIFPRKALILGGEASNADWIATIQAQCPDCQIFNHYGPTEATVGVLIYPLNKADLPLNTPTLPLGKAIANTQIYILDPHLQPVPIGTTGELYIGGDGLARGYLNHQELTEQKFISNPFLEVNGNSPRLYQTGDIARYLPDGNIEYLGRIDNQVKIRGFRLELGEIESVLATHPQIKQAVAIAFEQSLNHKYLVAYIVTEKESITSISLHQYLSSKLPEYAIPSVFVSLESLPLTPNGKVDKKALPIPDNSKESRVEDIAPHTEIEQILGKIWQELLLVEQVSIHDNFFEIGGDSIVSIQMISRAKNAGIKITAKQIFQHQTIAELAKFANTIEEKILARQGIVTGLAPLTPIQHRFFEQNYPQANHYNQSVLLQIPQSAENDLLRQAVAKLLEHHDALRLRFSSELKQIEDGLKDDIPLAVVDLSSTPQELQIETLERATTEFQRSLNLSSGRIIQVVVFDLGAENDKRLLIIVHHLAIDGVSWRILLSDFKTIYQQLVARQPVGLSAKTTAFIDWADKLNDYARSETIGQELDYWLDRSWSQNSPVPTDKTYLPEDNTIESAETISGKLDLTATKALLGSANAAYNTQINDLLLGALALAWKKWTRRSQIAIALEGHGREEIFPDVDLSRTIGWFTSRFPVLLEIQQDEERESLIKSTKERLRLIPQRGIGFGILRYLHPDKSVNQKLQTIVNPEISFNYLGQFDQIQFDGEWKLASDSIESIGTSRSPEHKRMYLLDINALIVAGELQVNWTYSNKVHARTTIENLARIYLQELNSIIEHCQLETSWGYTPSDFPQAALTQSELDEILDFSD